MENNAQPQTVKQPYEKPDFQTIDIDMEAPLLTESITPKQFGKKFN